MTTVKRTQTHSIDIAYIAQRSRWLPLVVLPAAVVLLGAGWRPWLLMWALAVAIYLGLKWLTLADCREAGWAPRSRVLGYLLLWPGMAGQPFFGGPPALRPRPGEWAIAVAKTALGLLLVYGVAARVAVFSQRAAGWVGMLGIVLALHFGLFHVLALVWRSAGVAVRPIMNAPLRAASLGEFWGQRWNLGFRDLAHAHVFRPLARKLGAVGATLAAYAVSGVVHDVVISGPARAGCGLPTLYFLLQGCGVLLEHSPAGRRFGLGRGAVGRLFTAIVTIAPLAMLFHRPFVERIVLPMLSEIGAR